MADTSSVLSLCSGGLGLDIGYECATPGARVVCAVECDPFRVSYMAVLMEKGCLDPFPIWDDVRSFNGGPWRGLVDCITAGYPCQPFSIIGRKRGEADERYLWPDIARIIGECQPREVFLENVPAHVKLGLSKVVADLRRLGYIVPRPLLLEATAVGAPHRRERLFIYGLRERLCDNGAEHKEDEMADGSGQRPQGIIRKRSAPVATGRGSGTGIPLFAPGPEDPEWVRIVRETPSLEPSLCGMADGMAVARKRWLTMLGNGVVPLQAAVALHILRSRTP